jgi:hypothetical protein
MLRYAKEEKRDIGQINRQGIKGRSKCTVTRNRKAAIITYFGCIVAPGGSYGAPVRVARPFGVLPVASGLSPTVGPGSAEKHRIPEAQILGDRESDQSRSLSGVAGVACLRRTFEDLYRASD